MASQLPAHDCADTLTSALSALAQGLFLARSGRHAQFQTTSGFGRVAATQASGRTLVTRWPRGAANYCIGGCVFSQRPLFAPVRQSLRRPPVLYGRRRSLRHSQALLAEECGTFGVEGYLHADHCAEELLFSQGAASIRVGPRTPWAGWCLSRIITLFLARYHCLIRRRVEIRQVLAFDV